MGDVTEEADVNGEVLGEIQPSEVPFDERQGDVSESPGREHENVREVVDELVHALIRLAHDDVDHIPPKDPLEVVEESVVGSSGSMVVLDPLDEDRKHSLEELERPRDESLDEEGLDPGTPVSPELVVRVLTEPLGDSEELGVVFVSIARKCKQ